jgi:hypothetical protein
MITLSAISNHAAALIARHDVPTQVTLQWTEWPDGKPTVDVTTGASLATAESIPVQKSCTAKALFHSIAPAKSKVRMFAEMQVGDAILDFLCGFVRVTAAGDTGLVVGAVLMEWDLNIANRALASGQTAATATAVQVESLEQISFTVDSQKWVQCEIGDELARSWDSIFGTVKTARSILVRKSS